MSVERSIHYPGPESANINLERINQFNREELGRALEFAFDSLISFDPQAPLEEYEQESSWGLIQALRKKISGKQMERQFKDSVIFAIGSIKEQEKSKSPTSNGNGIILNIPNLLRLAEIIIPESETPNKIISLLRSIPNELKFNDTDSQEIKDAVIEIKRNNLAKISGLSDLEKDVYLLIKNEGLSNPEISDRLNIPFKRVQEILEILRNKKIGIGKMRTD